MRSGVQLLATPGLILQLGDRLTVVGEAKAIENVEKVLGNAVKTLKDPNLAAIFIGIVLGLVVLGKSFDFFSILGLLGLIGMNIKNAIVLVDQIDTETAAGKAPREAVISATTTRIVPVAMASGTTILGMLPLLFDAMFGGMAATIMGGLLVASALTLFVLPVAYCAIHKIK